MNIKLAAAFAAAAMMTGCAMPSIQPPADNNRDYQETYQAGFTEVWESTVDWFAINNIPIKSIEKESGLIGSDYALGADFSQVNCGKVDPGGMHVLQSQNVVANINVLVRDQPNGVTVQPNVFGQGTFTLRDVWYGIPKVIKADQCVTTGELEHSLHQYLKAHL